MEKISSATPLAHNNNAEMSPSTNTMSTMLSFEFDRMPKLAESSVRVAVPARANFKKSNTCGSLFAKCQCSNHTEKIIPLITKTDCDRERPKLDRISRKNQSFSHPDTPVIFTEHNRYPATTVRDVEQIFQSGAVQVKHSKRSSSPNIGEFSVGNVEIHPEFKVQVIPTSSLELDTPRRRALLKKGSKSFPSASRSSLRSIDSLGKQTFSSSYSVDEESEDKELCDSVSELQLDDRSTSPSSSSPSTVVEVHKEQPDEKLLPHPKTPDKITAERFFQVRATLYLLTPRALLFAF
jgi:hypothetical protein